MENKRDMDAVHSSDLDSFLDKIGLLDHFNSQSIKCKFCHKVVTRKNIYSVLRDGGSYKMVCSAPECIAELMYYKYDKAKKEGPK